MSFIDPPNDTVHCCMCSEKDRRIDIHYLTIDDLKSGTWLRDDNVVCHT